MHIIWFLLKGILLRCSIALMMHLVPIIMCAQVSPVEIKASLIVHFCENISWPEPITGDFVIGCYTSNNQVYSILKSATNIVTIQGKRIDIRRIDSFNEARSCHAVYYDLSDSQELIDGFKIVRENNVLLITDNYQDQLFVMINIVDETEKIAFKVNMSNLALAGFDVKPNILLNGGSVVDIKKAYEQFESRLRESRRRYESTIQQLAQNESLLKQKDAIILEREVEVERYKKEIDQFKQELEELNQQIASESLLLEQKTLELMAKDDELQTIYTDIESKLSELTQLRSNVEQLKIEADTLKTEIGKKNIVLDKQQESISNQRRYLYLLASLVSALLLAAFALSRLFLIKKKHNRELEDRVRQRTKELQYKTDQYLSLFNLAPVAIWELDFSGVKRIIDDLNFKMEQEYDTYVKNHPDFAIQCFRKLKFININSASLELYKITSIDEIYDLYEKLYESGSLSGLEMEFKMLFHNKRKHSFEAIRHDKMQKRLDVLITWLDISEQESTYSRVLLTMVDVTKLRKVESELRKHQENLEELVKERTDEIATLNEELRVQNEQLYDTNDALKQANLDLKRTNDALNEQKRKLNKALEELKRAQLQMVQSEKMASLGILTSGIAHEINNPLNFIQSGIYALEAAIAEASVKDDLLEEIHAVIHNMHIGVQRSSAIVKSLNAFSRKDSHVFRSCNVHDVIDNALLILNHEIKGKYVVNKQYTNEEFTLIGNEENLHQVFLNIIMNAVQAMANKGELTIKTQLLHGRDLKIIVSDTGAGMSSEVMDKIYDPFFTTKAPGEGVGMGLSIVYNIIREHKGTIQYFSELNQGTDVIITLPVNQ